MLVNCAVYEAGRKVADISKADIHLHLGQPGRFVWVAMNDATPEELEGMKTEFDLHELAVEDALHGHQRPKIEEYGDCLFVVIRTVDLDGENLREGEVVAGGSTISQQLAKNLFLSGERAWWRKAQEAVITVMIELIMDKRRILELYLNVIEWGDGVFGAEAAARYHFGISARQLSAEQAARLAAMIPSPRRYGPGRNTAYLQRRTQTLLARMNAVRIP